MEISTSHKVSSIPKYKRYSKHRFLKVMKKDYQLYLLIIPTVVYLIIFNYIPMYGVQIAFKDFVAQKGIFGSSWVGFKHFERFFSSYQFIKVLKNTLGLSLYQLVAGFPIPIIMALLLNQTRNKRFKKVVQTVTYAPHFISVVVLTGMLYIFLSPRSGFINNIIVALGGKSIFFMAENSWFKSIYVWSGIWQNTGWGTIIYLAALSGISPELYEAARVDGANKRQIIKNIDLPSIMPTAIILLILNIGKIMSVGFQKAFLMQNDLNLAASEIIATYTYKIGLLQAQYSYSSAIGLFNTIVNVILLVSVNKLSRKMTNNSLW